VANNPEYLYGPLDGGAVAPQFWALDDIEFPIDVQIDRVVYVCYTLDEETSNYKYAGEKVLPRKKLGTGE
jgi:hypothetical protein